MAIDNKDQNRENLKTMLRGRPLSTHANFRRLDGVLVDVPLMNAEFTINQKPEWTLESLAGGQQEFTADAPEAEEIELPPKPSEEIHEETPPDAPPEDNEHVAEGAEQLPKPSPTTPKKKKETKKAGRKSRS